MAEEPKESPKGKKDKDHEAQAGDAPNVARLVTKPEPRVPILPHRHAPILATFFS